VARIRLRRLGAALAVGMLVSLTLAQGQSAPATQRVFQALVNHDSAQAALAYQRIGDPVTALAYAQTTSPAPDAALLRQSAELALSLRRWDIARAGLEQILAADPADAWAHHQLGKLLAAIDKRSAIAHLNTAWTLDETYAQPLLIGTLSSNTDTRALAYQVGTTLADLGDYGLAEYAFIESAIFTASPSESLASVGLMRALQGLDYLPWVSQAQALAPESPEVHTLIGLAHRAAGLPFESLTELTIALNLAPLDPEINAQIANAYAVLGDEYSAAFWHGQAAILSGQDPHYVEAYHAAQTALPPEEP